MSSAIVVLLVHAAITLALLVSGSVLVEMHAISQGTFLAMVSGGIGLLSGGGTALAIVRELDHHPNQKATPPGSSPPP